ncbi:MAG: RluA family pseudouridine synthase [Verrucomicrobia bacterium]|nr:RluA family pseudouridine synthase [Verrucomicrobiota bacterium]MBU1734743.1 RluA family pseudouridine synthase [Verrucomicrobiota bacterium]MBU1857761.1 RluA family pseudouridine synthase [Verrucomicrobiota bacterium]
MSTPKTSLPPILFEDECLIAFDKPSGLLTVPDRWNKARSDLIGLIHQYRAPGIYNVHRLDAETSGILLCAKTKVALTALERQFATSRVKAHYMALVLGTLPEPDMVIRRELERDRDQPGRMRLTASYRRGACRTRTHAIEVFRAHSLLEAWPSGDKTHQVRIHLAHVGCPVVADAFYGNGRGFYLSEIKSDYKFKPNEPERPLIGRLALHAASLTFTHPVTQAELTITAPWPKDLSIAVKYLKKFAPAGGAMVP